MSHYAFILKVAGRVAPCPDLVRDIAHQVVVDFISHHERWKTDIDPRPILAKMTRDAANLHRRQWNWTRPETIRKIADYLALNTPDETEQDWLGDAEEQFDLCLNRLTPEARKLFERHYRQNETHEEIAVKSGKTIHAVYQTFFRIREALRQCIERSLKKD